MNFNFEKSQKLVLILIVFGVLARLIPHPPNFSPVTAIALFSGLNFTNKKIAFTVPLTVLIISDFFLGFSLVNLFVYFSFLTIVFIGTQIKKIKYYNILFSSIIFFIISNFGVWMNGMLYPKTIQGLIDCYTMAIPFCQATFLSDMIYTSMFFSAMYVYGSYNDQIANRFNIVR